MDKIKVLFVCVHNSARSQMAEAILQQEGGNTFLAESAGLEPGTLNPYVIQALQEIGIDINNKKTNDVFTFFQEGRKYDYVITVCDKTVAERCPVFPGALKTIAWSFADPSQFTGTQAEVLEQVRVVRNQIKLQIQEFIAEVW